MGFQVDVNFGVILYIPVHLGAEVYPHLKFEVSVRFPTENIFFSFFFFFCRSTQHAGY